MGFADDGPPLSIVKISTLLQFGLLNFSRGKSRLCLIVDTFHAWVITVSSYQKNQVSYEGVGSILTVRQFIKQFRNFAGNLELSVTSTALKWPDISIQMQRRHEAYSGDVMVGDFSLFHITSVAYFYICR